MPWRYTAADYRAAVLRCAQPPLSPLVSTPTETPWEPALATAVAELGVRVEGGERAGAAVVRSHVRIVTVRLGRAVESEPFRVRRRHQQRR
ncbi:DUF2399 domain-containing protein [Streptomyces sp. NBC_00441]|uniref:DUF2399 domain-containing protein n=1 Tax=Streptomyces sp. NBC_00441 TaxID=2975742 RepID=UPI002E27C39D|nr:DUF2399 domain-containing protein [Streptomyces sp. NBC_00441]